MLRFIVALLVGGFCMLSLEAADSQLPWQQRGGVGDLAPGALLVASRALDDPSFVETVILLLHHGEQGAMGLIVNRRTTVPIARVFESDETVSHQVEPVFVGGPVARTGVQVLVRSSSPIADGRSVWRDIHLIGSAEALRRRLSGPTDAERFRVYLGYAGWSPGQLEREVETRSWHVLPPDADIVFDRDPDTLWTRQIRRTGVIIAWDGYGRHDYGL